MCVASVNETSMLRYSLGLIMGAIGLHTISQVIGDRPLVIGYGDLRENNSTIKALMRWTKTSLHLALALCRNLYILFHADPQGAKLSA
jgi:hypothetical protein